MEYVKPPQIKPGDMVGIVAPSDAVGKYDLDAGIRIVTSWGLRVKLGKFLLPRKDEFTAGNALERQQDLLSMIDDPQVKVIWAAQGGYAAPDVLVVFTKDTVMKLKVTPKWFIGYSDTCVLLNALSSYKCVSLHGPHIASLPYRDKKSLVWLRHMLFQGDTTHVGKEADWKCIIPGMATGRLLVSNLESLIVTLGTRFDPLMYGTGDIILGIEEWLIEKSLLARQIDMIFNHKRSSRIKAFIIGRLVAIVEHSYPSWGKKITVSEIIEKRTRRFGAIPLVHLSDFGHSSYSEEINWLKAKFAALVHLKEPFLCLPNGILGTLIAEENRVTLSFLEQIADQPFTSLLTPTKSQSPTNASTEHTPPQ